MRLVPLAAVRRLPWPALRRAAQESCESTSCPVCRPWPEGYPGGTAMRWKPGHWEGPSRDYEGASRG